MNRKKKENDKYVVIAKCKCSNVCSACHHGTPEKCLYKVGMEHVPKDRRYIVKRTKCKTSGDYIACKYCTALNPVKCKNKEIRVFVCKHGINDLKCTHMDC